MTKNRPRIPQSKVPIIGEKEKEKAQAVVQELMAYLDPILNNVLTGIDNLERRVAVVEGIQKVFPDNVNVIIKHEKPQIINMDMMYMIVKEVKKALAKERE